MFQRKRVLVTIDLWFILFVLHSNALRHVSYDDDKSWRKGLHRKAAISKFYNPEDFLIKTPGCSIPNYTKTMQYQEATDWERTCNKRLVFVTKLSNDKVKFKIDYASMNIYLKTHWNRFRCCYRLAFRSNKPGYEDDNLKFTKCKAFANDDVIKLEGGIITVACGVQYKKKNYTSLIYKDAYMILKKRSPPVINRSKGEKWNVLLLGMDTMSRGRAYKSIPRIVKYFQEHKWLDYRGYHKVDHNTFPNMMAVLTGQRPLRKCSKSVHNCTDMFIWNRFKQAGYMTAFGEDANVGTFSPSGFKNEPTDHYSRPFFTLSDYVRGNIVCTRTEPSSAHLVDYAKQFVRAYKNNNFFGLFWFSYFSHDAQNLPRTSENILLPFFDYLHKIGVLKNTFVIFFSDHGFNFGDNTISVDSYYDSRLPMFFMWVPLKFRTLHKEKYNSLQVNQHRLTTPFDVHGTLWEILKLGNSKDTIVSRRACPYCNSLFNNVSQKRTCTDAKIDEVWCACHTMDQTKTSEPFYEESIKSAFRYVQSIAKSVKTKKCALCSPLKLKSVIRSHWYKIKHALYFVVAFNVEPIDMSYEAVVKKTATGIVTLKVKSITTYKKKSNCYNEKLFSYAKGFCLCTYYPC